MNVITIRKVWRSAILAAALSPISNTVLIRDKTWLLINYFVLTSHPPVLLSRIICYSALCKNFGPASPPHTGTNSEHSDSINDC
jgi:hypothetical protein